MTEILFLIGRPFSPLYSLLMRVRELMYRHDIFRSYRPSVPVISVGNLTMGGTGKTPVVQMICRYLQKRQIKTAIVSRGYGGRASNKVNLVSDGKTVLMRAEEAGDEPRLHGDLLPEVVVATGKDRRPVCRFVEEELQCQTIVLDDGFQHLKVQRDVDLVLFDSTNLAGNSRVFPGGELREPVSSLHRADAFIMTGTTKQNHERAQMFSELLNKRFGHTPVFFSYIEVNGAKRINDSSDLDVDRLPSALYGFCGIANPERFRNSLLNSKINLCGFTEFKDHTLYNESDIQLLEQKAKHAGATGLITTEKDMVKLAQTDFKMPIFALTIQTLIDDAFWDFLQEKLETS